MRNQTLPSLMVFIVSILILPSIGTAQVKSPAPYVSEIREQCIAEMAKDAEINVACMTEYSDAYHAQDARQATKNNKHVVMAYAAIWGVMTVFLVAMWLRQRKLSAEIARLEVELKKAIAE